MINRIYQGRVTGMETNHGTLKDPEWHRFEKPEWEQRLREHHATFQAAVNYYLVALAALADPAHAASRLIQDLRTRIKDAWKNFPRPTSSKARGLRESLTPWLRLSDHATPEDAYAVILEGNEADPQVRALALALLLEKCGGESAIQQGGRGYLPKFSVSRNENGKPYEGSWDFDAVAVAANKGKSRLAGLIHSEFDESELVSLARQMDITWAGIKCKSDETIEGNALAERLNLALEHQIKRFRDPNRLLSKAEQELIISFPELTDYLDKQRAKIQTLSKDIRLAINKGGNISWDLVYSTYLFKVFPSAYTAGILSLSIKKPKSDSSETNNPGPDFAALGDDPIKLARGARGYVFPAFTALPDWNPLSPGEPVWKEFDIAAFKEALKSLNQFNQKTAERLETENNLRGQLAIMLGGKVPGWKPRKTDSGEEEAVPEPLDTMLFALARELERTLTENLDDTVLGELQTETFGDKEYVWREGESEITRAALRGLNDISEEWRKVHAKHKGRPPCKALEDVVKEYQADEKNRRAVGSVQLFLLLCEERFWPLWLSDDESEEADTSRSFLREMAAFHMCHRDFRRSLEPINLTPAEPIHSRRLYMFSDIKDQLAKIGYGTGSEANTVQCAIVYRDADNVAKEVRVRLHYSAKRLLRDELQGGEESRWLQPMTRALGLPVPKPEEPSVFNSALSLMPDPVGLSAEKDNPQLRFLLNFPVTLDPGWIHQGLGKSARWRGQFNGTRDKNLHLHWPKTFNDQIKGVDSGWWLNPVIIENGFTTLSVDLGQRAAGAYALLKISCCDPRKRTSPTKRPVRDIGFDGKRHWFAEVLTTGMLRLPGEDIETPDNFGGTRSRKYDSKGRPANDLEWQFARKLAEALEADIPENWVGKSPNEKRFPEQNDALIALANRRLSRLNTFHRWSCFNPDRTEVAARRENLIEKLAKELSHWRNPEVIAWKQHFDSGDFKAFREAAGEGFLKLRKSLGEQLLDLANRIAPLRDRSWEWAARKNGRDKTGVYRELQDSGLPLSESKVWIRGQRGLSLARIEQLENLRRLFLRHNRSFDREPDERASFGPDDLGRNSGEPCRLLLDKIDRMKEQRVNQTAHLILAEALGVRLKAHDINLKKRRERDIHGEYERIPGRQPVDFIVIENLDRYLTSQGRGPSENSRLMKWAHRAVRDKIKMLAEEPFGIPVLETAAAWSSRFSAKTGSPGFRCEERTILDDWLRDSLMKRMELPEKRGQPGRTDYEALLNQFKRLAKLNEGRQTMDKMPHSLLLPKTGGPLFLSLDADTPWQADINAAINLGLRAVAAPDAIHLIHKIRTELDRKDTPLLFPIQKNAREKAAFEGKPAIVLKVDASEKLSKAANPNFFYNHQEIAKFDAGTVEVGGNAIPVAFGMSIWSRVNEQAVTRVVDINRKRLNRWELKADKDDLKY